MLWDTSAALLNFCNSGLSGFRRLDGGSASRFVGRVTMALRPLDRGWLGGRGNEMRGAEW